MQSVELTERQQRELDYHRNHAGEHARLAQIPLDLDHIHSPKRRWWNHYWDLYTRFQGMDLKGKSILVDGSGFGNDALSLTQYGARVTGNDLSPESIAVAQARARNLGITDIQFDVAPCETLPYHDGQFDIVLFYDILHHVDIPKAMMEARRVLKPGGTIIIGEPYTHGIVQKVLRENFLVERVLYPMMKKLIYQTDQPYITEDERKLNHKELDYLRSQLNVGQLDYFYIILTRIVPARFAWFARFDRVLCKALGPLGRIFSGRFYLMGTIK